MIRLDDNLLIELGLGGLPLPERQSLLAHLLETLELRVGMRLAAQLSDQQLDEFEALLPAPQDSATTKADKERSALAWLETHFPDYKAVVAEELDKLKAEIKLDAPKILGTSGQANPPAATTA